MATGDGRTDERIRRAASMVMIGDQAGAGRPARRGPGHGRAVPVPSFDRLCGRQRQAASIGALLLPIVALKAGRTGAGRRAASSHTATMEAGELAVEALFHQAVVIRAGTLEEMFDTVAVVSSQPAPAGTAGRGADQRRRPAHPGRRGLRSGRAAGAGTVGRHPGGAALRLAGPGGYRDPVDVVASASAEQYGRSLRLLGAAEEIDAITVVFIVPFLPCAEDVTREIIAAVADLPAKPVIGDGPSSAGQPRRGRPERHVYFVATPESRNRGPVSTSQRRYLHRVTAASGLMNSAHASRGGHHIRAAIYSRRPPAGAQSPDRASTEHGPASAHPPAATRIRVCPSTADPFTPIRPARRTPTGTR